MVRSFVAALSVAVCLSLSAGGAMARVSDGPGSAPNSGGGGGGQPPTYSSSGAAVKWAYPIIQDNLVVDGTYDFTMQIDYYSGGNTDSDWFFASDGSMQRGVEPTSDNPTVSFESSIRIRVTSDPSLYGKYAIVNTSSIVAFGEKSPLGSAESDIQVLNGFASGGANTDMPVYQKTSSGSETSTRQLMYGSYYDFIGSADGDATL